jgi:hypothetical protein
VTGTWDDENTTPKIPLCAMLQPTFTEATREKEIHALLKFGRDSTWPLKIAGASALDQETSLSVTYEAGWEDCYSSIAWVWNQFRKAAIADGLTQPPAFQRDVTVRKGNNTITILLRETAKDGSRPITPEDTGLPEMILYAPNAIIKLRSHADKVTETLEDSVTKLYQGRTRIIERLETKEWAMVGLLGNDELTGVIPRHHKASTRPEALPTASAFCQRVHEAGLKTQNYDKGFDKFVRKFDPKEEMEATGAVTLGCREDHGWAVYCTQGARMCLLLDTVDGLTDYEALWTAMSTWASFQPTKANQRRNPGKLFYPTEASHVFEKYWDYFTCLNDHPDFASESPYCQEHMVKFSRALAATRHK